MTENDIMYNYEGMRNVCEAVKFHLFVVMDHFLEYLQPITYGCLVGAA